VGVRGKGLGGEGKRVNGIKPKQGRKEKYGTEAYGLGRETLKEGNKGEMSRGHLYRKQSVLIFSQAGGGTFTKGA